MKASALMQAVEELGENSIEPGLVIMHPNRATSVLCQKFPKNFLIHPPRTKTTSERGPPFSMRGAFVVALVRWPCIKKAASALKIIHSIGCVIVSFDSYPLIASRGRG